MPIRFEESSATFEGVCAPEEALELLEWLRGREAPKVDLAGCDHMHAAVLQVLLAVRPTLVSGPKDPFLASWVSPLLENGHCG